MTLDDKQRSLVKTLAQLPTVADRLAWLIEQARQRPLLPVDERIDVNRVEGCLARLWLVAEFRNNRCHFRCDSDSLLVKAVAGLLCDFYSDESPDEILGHTPEFLGKLGINQHISPTRRNAFSSAWQRIAGFAKQHPLANRPSPRDSVRN